MVVDPTLLYDDYPDQGLDLPDKYIAVYLIGRGCDADHQRVIKGLRDKYGDLPILCLMPTGFAIELHDWCDEIYWHLTPFEWVELIKRSTAVYTDSFHAVLFSMRNRVPFTATYVEPIRAPRLIDLQSRYALRDSICKASEAGKPVSDNDWQTIENYWKSEREHSMSLLANYLAE